MDPGTNLRELADKLYRAEYTAIKNTKFPSTPDRLRALQSAKDALDDANQLLDAEEEHEQKSPPLSPEGEKAREELRKYLRASLWSCCNCVNNMTVRSGYIRKTKMEVVGRLTRLRRNPGDLDLARNLAQEAAEARNKILEATRSKLSKSSEHFSQNIKKEGLSFDALVRRYTERHFEGEMFENLDIGSKIRVYSEIIEASGRSNSLVNTLSKVSGALGAAQLLLTVGFVVWDVIMSDDRLYTLTKEVWMSVGSVAAGVAGETLATAAISKGLVAFGVAGSTKALAVVLIGGVAAGIILAVAAAPVLEGLFDLMVDSFSLHIPPELTKSLITATKIPLASPLTVQLTTPLRL